MAMAEKSISNFQTDTYFVILVMFWFKFWLIFNNSDNYTQFWRQILKPCRFEKGQFTQITNKNLSILVLNHAESFGFISTVFDISARGFWLYSNTTEVIINQCVVLTALQHDTNQLQQLWYPLSSAADESSCTFQLAHVLRQSAAYE